MKQRCDGVLAYFGYPRAHEDDAERAVRAGLQLTQAVKRLTSPVGEPLMVRVGIATGLVVVGDLIGEGAAQEEAVVGETPNLAARLQNIAEPNTIVISTGTRQLLGSVFDLADLGGHALKGFATPVRVWQVLGEASSESRFEATHGLQLSPLVGRDDELEVLARCWRHAKRRAGQVVLISGEPGIGKSRLCAMQRARLAEHHHVRMTYQCSPHHTGSAFYPVIRQLERAAGIGTEDNADTRLDRLEVLVGSSRDGLCDHVQVLAGLLSIPTEGRYPVIERNPQQQKERIYQTLVHLLERLAEDQPVLGIFEDLHWADPSTLELLDRLIQRAETLPTLLLVTARPGFRAPWFEEAHVTVLTLGRISRRDSHALLVALVGSTSLSEDLIDDIVAKGDGNPLFVEEMTHAVLDACARDSTVAAGHGRIEVPASLQDSLMARLDRLTVGKPVAQVASAIGREFTSEMLEPICGLSEQELDKALNELVTAGVLNRRGTPPNVSFLFKHALIQDTAYNSLVRTKRKRLHQQIAEVFDERFSEQPAMLADHWEFAGSLDKSLEHRLKAAEKATRQHAMWEAIAQYWRALLLLEQLPDSDISRRQHVQVVVALIGTGLVFWQSEAEQQKALNNVNKALETARRADALAHLAQLEAFKGGCWMEEPFLQQALKHAEMVNDDRLIAQVERRYAGYLGKAGEFDRSHAHVSRAIQIYAELGAEVEHGLAMAVEGRCYSARAGKLKRALQFARRASEIAEATGDPGLKSWLAMEAEPFIYQGLWEQTVQVVDQNLPLAWELGNWGVILFSSAWATQAHIKLGRLQEAHTLIEQAMSIAGRRTAHAHHQIYPEIAISQLRLASGEADAAVVAGQRALEFSKRAIGRMEEGAAHRVIGEALQAKGRLSEAERHFRQSLDILGNSQSMPELAQSLLTYGSFRLVHDVEDGRCHLRRALTMFEDMDATGWIEEVNAALSTSDRVPPRAQAADT